MKKQPTLSIITVCYNIADEIERTCESIVNQTWHDFEWIVIDGGSTDGTLEILKKYKKHINLLISERDTGIYNAMNKGIKHAHGKWLNFMNGGDCFYEKDVLKKVFYNKKYNADILYGYLNIIEKDNSEQILKYQDKINKNYFYEGIIGHQASFIKRKLFKKYGLYNENYRIVSDWEKWIIFAEKKCIFQRLNFIVSKFWNNGISSDMSQQHIIERDKVYKKLYCTAANYYLFGIIPILKIKECF